MIKFIIFFPFIPRPSLVETPITIGILFLSEAFVAMVTVESVIPFASLAIKLPVAGAITNKSSFSLGPNFSASIISETILFPVISSIIILKFSPFPKRVSFSITAGDTIGIMSYPKSFKLIICSIILETVQKEEVIANPIFAILTSYYMINFLR